jgi:hypothetical protein
MDKDTLKQIDSFFESQDVIDKADIISLLHSCYPTFQPRFIPIYFWELRRAGLFYLYDETRVRRIGSLKEYVYKPDPFEANLWKNVLSMGEYYPACLYSSSAFNDFISLQIIRKYYFIEVPREAFDSVADGLTSFKKEVPFIFSKDFAPQKILWSNKNIIVISPLIVGAPIARSIRFFENGRIASPRVATPTIEKLLVDAYCDDKILDLGSTGQIVDLFHTALADYMVNFRTLFSYCKKRNAYPVIKDFIRSVVRFDIDKGRFIDD